MPQEALGPGALTTILQNIVYVLPPKVCRIQSSAAIEGSLDGTTFAAMTGADTTGVDTVAGFIRCTTGTAKVLVKTYT